METREYVVTFCACNNNEADKLEKIINSYYEKGAQKLHKMVDRILLKFGIVNDLDNYYSLANEVFCDVAKRWDKVQNFDVFLFSCLSNKIKTELTRQNRYKRTADRNAISIETQISEDVTVADMLATDYCLEDAVLGEESSETIKKYLKTLSKRQRMIVRLLIDGYRPAEIKKKLHMRDRDYSDDIHAIYSHENVEILYKEGR